MCVTYEVGWLVEVMADQTDSVNSGCSLKDVNDKITDKRFLRIHRSYIANLSHIDEIGSNHVLIASRSLPLSKNMRTELFQHLQVI